MHYLVIGHDHPGVEGRQRRAAAREEHLARLTSTTSARPVFGAGMLDEGGEMIGSILVLEAESPAAVQAWLDDEPYVVADVWREVSVLPCQVPPTFLPNTGGSDEESSQM
jgi:uncharacterized protein YciI